VALPYSNNRQYDLAVPVASEVIKREANIPAGYIAAGSLTKAEGLSPPRSRLYQSISINQRTRAYWNRGNGLLWALRKIDDAIAGL